MERSGSGGAAAQESVAIPPRTQGKRLDAEEGQRGQGNGPKTADRAAFLPSSPPARPPTVVPLRSNDITPKPGNWLASSHSASSDPSSNQQGQQQQPSLFGWVKSAIGGLAPSPAAMGMSDVLSPRSEAQVFADAQRSKGNRQWPRSARAPSETSGGSSGGAGRLDTGEYVEDNSYAGHGAFGGSMGLGYPDGEVSQARSSYQVSRKMRRAALPATPDGNEAYALPASARSSMSYSDSGVYSDEDPSEASSDDGEYCPEGDEYSDDDSIATEEELYVPFQSRQVPPPLVRPAARRDGATLALGPDSPINELSELTFAPLSIDNSNSAQSEVLPQSNSTGSGFIKRADLSLNDPRLQDGNAVVEDMTPASGGGALPSFVLAPPGDDANDENENVHVRAGVEYAPIDRTTEATPVPGGRRASVVAAGAGDMANETKEQIVLGSRGRNGLPSPMAPALVQQHWSDEDRSKTPLASAGRPSMNGGAAGQAQVQAQQLQQVAADKKAARAERKSFSEASATVAPPMRSNLSSASSSTSNGSGGSFGAATLAIDQQQAPAQTQQPKRGFFGRSKAGSGADADADAGKLSRRGSESQHSRRSSLSSNSGGGGTGLGPRKSNWLFGGSRHKYGSSAASSASSAASNTAHSSEAGSAAGIDAADASSPKQKGGRKDRKSGAHTQSVSEASINSLDTVDDDQSLHSVGGQSSTGRKSVAGSSVRSESKAPKKLKLHYKNKSSKERNFDKIFLAQELHVGSGGGNSRGGLASTRHDSLASCISSLTNSSMPSPGRPPLPHLNSSASLTSNDSAQLANGRPLSVHSTAPSVASSTASHNKGRAIWAMRWSPCGHYLAVAGQTCVITIYEVLSTKAARQQEVELARMRAMLQQSDNSAIRSNGSMSSNKKGKNGTPPASSGRDQFPVLSSTPVRELRGHSLDVLDISWSKNNFLLSCSMDKTAKLWHISRDECLCTFAHLDFVTAACFHPKDDRFFISGSLDGKLRLWNIPAKKVQASQEVPGLITACTFTQSGATACVGTFSGAALFYETERLTYSTSIAVRSSSSKNARGRKITGIEPVWTPDGSEKVLITSNDSRVRVYDIKLKRLAKKFKGATYLNRTSQIRASVSDDGNFVVSGSEDAHVYIWDAGTGPASLLSLDMLQGKGKNPDASYEYWTAHPGTVTSALVAPLKAHGFLEASEDPISIHASMQQAGKVSNSTTSTLTAISLANAVSPAMPAHMLPGGLPNQPNPAFDAKRNRIICTVDESSTLRVWRADSYGVLKNMAPTFALPPQTDSTLSKMSDASESS